jgi:integrase
MLISKSTKSTSANKPAKPHKDFPLFPHATKRWAKKVRGKLHYFGPWDDPQGALNRWLAVKDDLLAGRTPRTTGEGFTIRDLCNRFLTEKQDLVNTGELSPRTFRDYKDTCDIIVKAFGKGRVVSDLTTDDFRQLRQTMNKTRGHVSMGNTIQRIRTVFKFAYDSELIDKPVRFGPHFRRPSAKAIRQDRNENGQKMYEPDEIHKMLAAASPQLRAMVLLGINCGFGNDDVSTLPLAAVDLKNGWVEYARNKTAVRRRCPLWPETMTAIRKAIDTRPTPKVEEAEGQVFVTKYGKSWHKDTPDNPISKQMRKLLDSIGFHKKGVGFYALRRTFETIGGERIDQVAVNAIMGHVDISMAGQYRERISDERLKAVTDTVHKWLFGDAEEQCETEGQQSR